MKHLFTILLCCISILSYAQVQQDCGATDCPGRCGRFIDQNGDGFCDHGRLSAPVEDNHSSSEETPTVSKSDTNSKKDIRSKKPSSAKESIVEKPSSSDEGTNEEYLENTKDTSEDEVCEEPVKAKKPYNLILISALTLGLYAVTFALVKTNKMKKATHRKIWNILLLITALVSCLLGFFLVIQINYNLKMDWLWTVKLYHVQFGISMTLIAVIHIVWHINYWKSYFKK